MNKTGDLFLSIIIYISWALLLFVSIFYIINSDYISIAWLFALFLMIFIYYRYKVSKGAYTVIVFMVVMHILGSFFEFFTYYELYDKVLHFINPFLLCFFFYITLRQKAPNRKKRIIYSTLAVLFLILFWEFLEYLADNLYNLSSRGDFLYKITEDNTIKIVKVSDATTDTILDIIAGIIGILAFLTGIKFLSKNKNKKK